VRIFQQTPSVANDAYRFCSCSPRACHLSSSNRLQDSHSRLSVFTRGLFWSRKIRLNISPLFATLTHMKNYCRLSGDGSVKVALRGDSNSPPKTTSRREPLPYNSSSTQEVCTPSAIPFAFLRVHSRFQKNVDFSIGKLLKFQKKPVFAHIRGLSDNSPAPERVDFCPFPILAFSLQPSALASSSFDLYDLCPSVARAKEDVFVFKGKFPSHPKFQKKPVFALIRGLCDSHPEPKFSTIPCRFSAATDHGHLATDKSENVDYHPFHPRGSAIIENYRLPLIPPTGQVSLQKNNFSLCYLCGLRVFVVVASFPPSQNVDFPRSPFSASVQNAFKKARESAIIHVSTFHPSTVKPSNFQTLNLRTVPRTSHLVSPKNARNSSFLSNSTSTSHQKVHCEAWDYDFGNSLVISALPALRSLVVPLSLRRGTGGGGTLVIRGSAAVSLQKINFSVSATLKQPSLQMNHLRRFCPEKTKKY
jgi:hypothetical protein